ncbi:nucleotidyltransferase domain-containing protein [Chitinilyticum aquatile]|uniref:nucleotidyltransferase domain-containing protein n=1 Tax=Chitinilyticum aquatile TaxID=362520 RepID=UPI000411AB84|nr:nucleotidyltransferase domain-containing protein [Chitinilyticum aquatile]
MDTRFAHPLDESVRQRVLHELQVIEARHAVRVLFACESGSRAWGFASPDSDYDVRFVYVHESEWYLRVEPQRDVIELPISDELDISGWELRKALQLLNRSNPTLFEWLASPLVYRSEPDWVEQVSVLAPCFYSSSKGYWHYRSMAKKNFRGYLQGETVRLKKYLYVLRPLLAAQWIESGRGIPPMRFATLVDALLADQPALCAEIDALLARKMAASEGEYGARMPCIHDWIASQLAEDVEPPDFDRPPTDSARLDALLWQQVSGMNESMLRLVEPA